MSDTNQVIIRNSENAFSIDWIDENNFKVRKLMNMPGLEVWA
jgi:hypothetical protein